MTDPVIDYLNRLSLDELERVEKSIYQLAAQRKAEAEAAEKAHAIAAAKEMESSSSFRLPATPSTNSTEQLANSLGLDISQLMKEVKAWSR
ncbi:hypothetical protein [Nitrincola tapanii]|uniref:Uncharacterized protein n=1 Tax=Nitrincola tapanii TaxID=1708751 RepID=A0A5A9W3Y0_9GAMM|nr:hypothetical protein [Nitrincola tapanii]KAA0875417.1 hypothetical protein E1H14_05365 [Nitrincola tapanii]